jgi:hypothetical protein
MLYNEKSKNVQMENLFNNLNSAITNEEKEATRSITANEFYNEKYFTSDNEQNNKNDDASIIPSITSEFFNRY